MNIFITDKCPNLSAKYLDDKRVNKMILESAQMLSTCLALNGLLKTYEYTPVKFSGPKNSRNLKVGKSVKLAYYYDLTRLPAKTHENHSCNLWVRESRSNYKWLLDHFSALCEEKVKRTNKRHAYVSLYGVYAKLSFYLQEKGLTSFPNCAKNEEKGLDYTKEENVFVAYKKYLTQRWNSDKLKPTWYGKVLNNKEINYV